MYILFRPSLVTASHYSAPQARPATRKAPYHPLVPSSNQSPLLDTSIRSISPIRGNTLTALGSRVSIRVFRRRYTPQLIQSNFHKHDYEAGWQVNDERVRSSIQSPLWSTPLPKLCESHYHHYTSPPVYFECCL